MKQKKKKRLKIEKMFPVFLKIGLVGPAAITVMLKKQFCKLFVEKFPWKRKRKYPDPNVSRDEWENRSARRTHTHTHTHTLVGRSYCPGSEDQEREGNEGKL